jgi:Mlc titration factor MtfA (ptsG expression regulator)
MPSASEASRICNGPTHVFRPRQWRRHGSSVADVRGEKSEREFFAVTASIFFFHARNLKEKQPAYYKYLAGLFEFDPESTPSTSPVASAF